MIQNSISKKIKYLNLINTFFIVIYHCGDSGQLIPINTLDEIINRNVDNSMGVFGVLAMNYFFLISGFLLYSNLEETLSAKIYFGKINRRLISLFIPYLIWNIIYNYLPFMERISFNGFIKNVFLFNHYPPCMPMWYCYSILVLSLISPVFYYMFKGDKGIFFLLIICSIVIVIMDIEKGVVGQITQKGTLWNTFHYLAAYLVGLYCGMNNKKFSESNNCLSELIISLFIFLVLSAFIPKAFDTMIIPIVTVLLLYLLPTINENNKINKYIFNISNISFLIFCTHEYWCARLQRFIRIHLLLKIYPYAWFANIACRIIILIFVVLFAWVFWYILGVFSPFLLKILSGGRCKVYKKE